MNDAPISTGPGIPAFIAFVFLVIALWLLMRNMNARLRRMSYRQRAEDEAAAQARAARAQAVADDQATDAGAVADKGSGKDADVPPDEPGEESPFR